MTAYHRNLGPGPGFVSRLNIFLANKQPGDTVTVQLEPGIYVNGLVGVVKVGEGVRLTVLGPVASGEAELRPTLIAGTILWFDLGDHAVAELVRVDIIHQAPSVHATLVRAEGRGTLRIDSCAVKAQSLQIHPNPTLVLASGHARVEIQNALLASTDAGVRLLPRSSLSVRDSAFEVSGRGISAQQPNEITTENCWFDGCRVGIWTETRPKDAPTVLVYTDCRFERCGEAVVHSSAPAATSALSEVTTLSIDGCEFVGAARELDIGVRLELPWPIPAGGTAVRVDSCVFRGLDRGVVVTSVRADRVLIAGNTFDVMATCAIDLSGVSLLEPLRQVTLALASGGAAVFLAPPYAVVDNVMFLDVPTTGAPGIGQRGGVCLPAWLDQAIQPTVALIAPIT